MTPETVAVDETLSFAHRDNEDVVVRLRVPEVDLPAGTAAVALHAGRQGFEVPAEIASDGHGVTLSFTAPGARLRRAVWSLDLQPASGGPSLRVEARLLARRDQPVALLPGPVPATRLAAPEPRTRRSLAGQALSRLPSPVQRALRRGRALTRRPTA